MEASPIPRVNFEAMQRMTGRRVSLVGEVESVSGNQYVVLTSDKGRVTVNGSPRGDPIQTRFVEFVGTVADGKTLNEDEHTNFGDNFGELEQQIAHRRLSTGDPAKPGFARTLLTVIPCPSPGRRHEAV